MSFKSVVSKFGGSSMADASRIKNVAKISVKQNASIVVVSATFGTTNQLVELANVSCHKSDQSGSLKIIDDIKKNHFKIAKELELNGDQLNRVTEILKELETLSHGIFLLKECSKKTYDSLISLGERLSSYMLSQYMLNSKLSDLEVEYLDPREIIITDDNFTKAHPQIDLIAKEAKTKLKPFIGKKLWITGGFVGATIDGVTSTLGRGGSDYSAALFAEAISADVLEIWTDVAGIATTDPRICDKARPIPEISYSEASELAIFGAKILHPSTLMPAIRQEIEVFVGSSLEPTETGTWIRKHTVTNPLVRAMALRKKQALLTLKTPKMLNSHGFLFNIFKVFNDHKISIDSITTSEIGVALTIDNAELGNKRLIDDLEIYADLEIEKDLTLVSLIGNKINHTPGLSRGIFKALDNINVRMICQGASKHNFCFLVNKAEEERAIRNLHEAFVETYYNYDKSYSKEELETFSLNRTPLKSSLKDGLMSFTKEAKGPFFCYDLDQLNQHLKRIQDSLPSGIKLFYATKANPLSSIISSMNKNGVGLDIASKGELNQVLSQGVKGQDIIATGPAKSKEYLNLLMDKNVGTIVFESIKQLKWANEIAIARNLKIKGLLRVQLTWSEGKSVLGGDSITPFGIELNDWGSINLKDFKNIDVMGLHIFQWGNILDISQLKNIWFEIAETLSNFAKKMSIELKVLDLGGGLGIPYEHGMPGLPFDEVMNLLSEVKKEFSLNEIWMELGRFAVGECGLYLTKVIERKDVRNRKILVLEGGINHIARGALTKQHFPVESLPYDPNIKNEVFQLHGPLCTALDFLGDAKLPETISEGDWLVFKQTGAYGFTESMPFFLCHDLSGELVFNNNVLSELREVVEAKFWLK